MAVTFRANKKLAAPSLRVNIKLAALSFARYGPIGQLYSLRVKIKLAAPSLRANIKLAAASFARYGPIGQLARRVVIGCKVCAVTKLAAPSLARYGPNGHP